MTDFKVGDLVRHVTAESFGSIIGTVDAFGEEWFKVRADDGFVYHAPAGVLDLFERAVDPDKAHLQRLLGEISEALGDNAERFTCTEAEAIYELYELAGLEADWFMRAHAHGDSELEEDLHLETDDKKGWTYR